MKQTLNFLLMLVMVATVFSCKKKDPEPLPVAEFTFTPNTGIFPITVTFTNTSLYADTYAWDFGGGAPTSIEKSPVVNFTTGGTFVVTLTATGAGGVTKATKNIVIRDQTSQEKIIGRYRLSAISVVSVAGVVIVNTVDACSADDIVDINTNNQFIIGSGALICYPNEPATQTLSYSLSSNGGIFILESSSYDVLELTRTTFKIRITDIDGSVRTLTLTKI